MARKRFTTDLTINAQDSYSCNISKNYTEVYNINQELSSNDAFVQIVSGSATKGIELWHLHKLYLLRILETLQQRF